MKKIGIWGLGTSGKSYLSYFANKEYALQIMDKRVPIQDEFVLLNSSKAWYICEQQQDFFLEYNDQIIASPGIDITPFQQYRHKFIAELDLFAAAWQKPKRTIAITGSLGKTSLVTLLHKVLYNAGKSVILGGNIGTGMLDLVNSQAEIAVLELSSFQLEYTTQFAPDIAVLTNLFPNHLDRHKTIEAYAEAKYQLFKRQTPDQKALIPLDQYTFFLSQPETANRPLALFVAQDHATLDGASLRPTDVLYCFDGEYLAKYENETVTHLIARSQIPSVGYEGSWIIIMAVLDLMGICLEDTSLNELSIPEHRCQLVATVNGVAYYNDSKATIAQSTLAAVENLRKKPIHLLIGGLSKGVNREPFINSLKGKVKSILCFGAEAAELYQFCQRAEIPAFMSHSLEDAFACARNAAVPGEVILLSPAGSSYDLFKDYKERGERFMSLTREI